MEVTVTKLTGVELLQRANSFTSGKESHMDLAKAYRYGHSPIRTQLFWVELHQIPLFLAGHLVRHNVGVVMFQRSMRTDRNQAKAPFTDVCKELASRMDYALELITNRKRQEGLNQLDGLANAIADLPTEYDRMQPTDLAFICNAECLMSMAHKRLCGMASAETRKVMQAIVGEVNQCDPDLAKHLVPQCVYRGGICPEPKGCGYITSRLGSSLLLCYKSLYSNGGQ